MLINPAAIVALLVYLIVGPFTASQRSQTRLKLKSFGHDVRLKIASLRRTSFEPQDYSAVFEATTVRTLPAAPAETTVIHPIQIFPSCPVPLEDHVEVVIPEVCPARYGDDPSPVPAPIAAAPSEHQNPFNWRDLFTYQAFDALTAVYFSIWLPLVAIRFILRLLSRSESPDKVEQPVDEHTKPLPPNTLTPPPTVHIWVTDPKSHAPLEPVFSPAPPEPSTFWLASKQQDQPSTPSLLPLRLLDLSALGDDSPGKLSPPSSPADSGYGTTLPGTPSGAPSPVSDKRVTATLERPTGTPTAADVEPVFVYGSKGVNIISDDPAGKSIDTTEYDTELDDDDDGSTTVTNSISNLADLTACPATVPAEELVAKLESVTIAPIEEVRSFPELPTEGPSATVSTSDDLAADLPSHDEPTMDPPSGNEPAVDLRTAIQEFSVAEISVDVCPPSKPPLDTTNTMCAVEKGAAGTGLETVTEEDKAPAGDDLPSQHDSEQNVEAWIPYDEIPTIFISPPSDVDPEDYAQQIYWEGEQGESEYTFGPTKLGPESRDECTVDYPVRSVAEAPTELRDDPYHSPIIASGTLWSDDESDDLGPLPFTQEIPHAEEIDTLETPDAAEIPEQPDAGVEQVETKDSPVQEQPVDSNPTTPEDLHEPLVEAAQELVEEPQPATEAPTQEAVEPAPVVVVPFPSPCPSLPSPPHVSRSYPIRAQASSDNEDRGEGSSRSGRTLEPRRPQYFHCCKLAKSDGRPESWENWKFEKPEVCIPKKTHLKEWQFVRPTDQDGKNPTTRIVIDNMDAEWFRNIEGIPSYKYLTEAMGFFSTKYFRCWRSRTINGVEFPYIGYATVDFDSLDEAIRMFDELQGKRLRGHTWHWRLEFVDPNDDTHGGRKVIRTDLVSDSVKQALAAELEASTRRNGRSSCTDNASTETTVVTRPPARVRPQVNIGGRSLFAGAMANVVQDRHTGEQATQSTARTPHRRQYRPRS